MSSEASHDIRIISEPISGDGATILMGFPGSGLVGSIALQYLVDQKEFKQIGTMTSKYFPPFAMMAKGLINVPVRIYQKEAIVAIVADIPIHPMICYEVATGLVLAIAFGIFGLLRADAAAAHLAGAFRHRHEPRFTPPFGPEGGPLAAPRPPPHVPSSRRF